MSTLDELSICKSWFEIRTARMTGSHKRSPTASVWKLWVESRAILLQGRNQDQPPKLHRFGFMLLLSFDRTREKKLYWPPQEHMEQSLLVPFKYWIQVGDDLRSKWLQLKTWEERLKNLERFSTGAKYGMQPHMPSFSRGWMLDRSLGLCCTHTDLAVGNKNRNRTRHQLGEGKTASAHWLNIEWASDSPADGRKSRWHSNVPKVIQLTKEPRKEQRRWDWRTVEDSEPLYHPIHEFPPIYSGLQTFVSPELNRSLVVEWIILPGAGALDKPVSYFCRESQVGSNDWQTLNMMNQKTLESRLFRRLRLMSIPRLFE